MGWNAWGRYFVELLLCLPAGFLCLAPVKGRLRVSMGTFLWAAVGSITAFAAVGALVIMLTGWPENALLVPGLLLFFWLYCRLTEVEPLPAVFIFLLAAAVMGFCAVITDVLMAQVEVANPGTVPTLIAAGLQLALGMLTAALMWPLMASRVGWLVEHFMQASVWRIVWVLPLAHMLLFIAMMPKDYHTILVNRVQPLGAIILVFLLGLMAFLIELFYRIARSITDSAALREENHFLAAQASQYALLSGYIRETRRLRHDFRQHLRVLSGLAAKGDAAALTAYLKEVGGEEHEEIRFVCANPSLNALAGYYDALARERGVALDWRVSLPEELNIPDAELCVLLGNLVENALDGALTLPEGKRGAKVICRMSGDLLCVIVENGYDGQVRRKKDGFASTKHSGESYGLESARATVARHHGFLTVDAEEDIFRVSLLMNLSANAEGG